MAEAPLPSSNSPSSSATSLRLLAQAYEAEEASDALLAVPPLDSSDEETASLLSEEADEEEAKVAATDDRSWSTVASFLNPDVLALADGAVLPGGMLVLHQVAIQRAFDAGCAQMIFDHHLAQAARHAAILAHARHTEITVAHAVAAATEAVAAAVTEAQATAARLLRNDLCNVTTASRHHGKCKSPWQSCPLLAHALVRATVGLPHREAVPCDRHPRLIRAACCVCMRRRRLQLLFSLHEPL
jgi:hypothetical protein